MRRDDAPAVPSPAPAGIFRCGRGHGRPGSLRRGTARGCPPGRVRAGGRRAGGAG